MFVVGFLNVRVPQENLLGREGKGYEVFGKSFGFSRIGNAAKLIGLGEGALDEAIAYARKRKIGDNVVTDFQGIRWQIVDLKTRLQAARLLTYEAACEYDAVGRSTKKSSMAKLLAATTAMEATMAAAPIAKCPAKADLNNDCKVNLIDFSIAAYWYKRIISAEFVQKESERLNSDGKVDLVDFSIMAFYWTG